MTSGLDPPFVCWLSYEAWQVQVLSTWITRGCHRCLSLSQPVTSLGHIVSFSISQSFVPQVVQYLTRISNLSGHLQQNCLLCWGLGLLFVWFSYCFHSQLCKPFSEVLFDPLVYSINHPKQSITLSGSQPVIQLTGPSVNTSLSQSSQLVSPFFHRWVLGN